MGIIGDIWTVATGLDAKRDRLVQAERADRDRIGRLFDDVANTLQRVVTDVRSDVVPHGACQGDAGLRGQPPRCRWSGLGGEADDMAELLNRAYEVERLWVELRHVPDPGAELRKLERSGGMFRAEAALLRAGA